ncbi:CST complex subunit STN1 [Bombina bombina]|uniref:CST complex subunit STN1 n=1 Tax=Bombina bombina TaxID=8345 RepID=UPI00235AA1D6|nr:CST complex subunit STN1 [Bombina bombina]
MEEIPSLLWGLDPTFFSFAKLYIKDILELKESHQVPGIFFYKGHPIKQVDILGTVVCVREKETFYNYGVDDSTGVINCTCWKSAMSTEVSFQGSATNRGTSGTSNLDEMMEKLYAEDNKKAKMEIGDIIRVRGYIKVFRNQREVVASTYCKVDDPLFDMQIARMLDLPYLYRHVYDKPFKIPGHIKDPNQAMTDDNFVTEANLISLLSDKVKDFLIENNIQNFYQRELECVSSLITVASQSTNTAENESKATSGSQNIHNLFKHAIRILQENGMVFQKSKNSDVYQVTDQDKELYKCTLNIIQDDSKRLKHADKGCHFLYIMKCVQQRFGSNITENVLLRVINALERNSDIVSVHEKYYTAF